MSSIYSRSRGNIADFDVVLRLRVIVARARWSWTRHHVVGNDEVWCLDRSLHQVAITFCRQEKEKRCLHVVVSVRSASLVSRSSYGVVSVRPVNELRATD